MRRICLLLAVVFLMAVVSVQAQKKGGVRPTAPVAKQLCLQDQDGRGFIMFDLTSGDFNCSMCEDRLELSGKGDVKVDGFNVYLSAVTDGYRMFISINIWDRQGKAVIEYFQSPDPIEPRQEFWTDVNIDNNSMKCVNIQPKQ